MTFEYSGAQLGVRFWGFAPPSVKDLQYNEVKVRLSRGHNKKYRKSTHIFSLSHPCLVNVTQSAFTFSNYTQNAQDFLSRNIFFCYPKGFNNKRKKKKIEILIVGHCYGSPYELKTNRGSVFPNCLRLVLTPSSRL